MYILAGPHRHVGEAETLGIFSCDTDKKRSVGSSEHLVISRVAAAANRNWAELQGHGKPSPVSRMCKAPNSTFSGLSKLLSGSFGQKQLVPSPNLILEGSSIFSAKVSPPEPFLESPCHPPGSSFARAGVFCTT